MDIQHDLLDLGISRLPLEVEELVEVDNIHLVVEFLGPFVQVQPANPRGRRSCLAETYQGGQNSGLGQGIFLILWLRVRDSSNLMWRNVFRGVLIDRPGKVPFRKVCYRATYFISVLNAVGHNNYITLHQPADEGDDEDEEAHFFSTHLIVRRSTGNY